MVCHHPDKPGNHKHCDSGHMFIIYHATSRDHMFKKLCGFMGGNPSQIVTTLPYLVAIELVQVNI